MQLKVGQADGTSLCPKGIVKDILEINDSLNTHSSYVKTLSNHFCFAYISLKTIE